MLPNRVEASFLFLVVDIYFHPSYPNGEFRLLYEYICLRFSKSSGLTDEIPFFTSEESA